MYDLAIEGMHSELLQTSTPSGLTYIAQRDDDGELNHEMEHLACFMGGLLALGAYTDPQGLDSARAQRDMKTAKVRDSSGNRPSFRFCFWRNKLSSGEANFYSVGNRRGRNKDQLKVFRRTDLPCPRCKTTIARIIVGQRSTHICTKCQKI